MWRKGNPFALLVGTQTGAATMESSMEKPEKIKLIPKGQVWASLTGQHT